MGQAETEDEHGHNGDEHHGVALARRQPIEAEVRVGPPLVPAARVDGVRWDPGGPSKARPVGQ